MTKRKIEPKPNLCHFCGKPVSLTPGRGLSWGWLHGETFGATGMIQAHHECLFAAYDAAQDEARGRGFPETRELRGK